MTASLDLTSDPVELTAQLVDIPSVSGSEDAIATAVESALREQAPHLEVVRMVEQDDVVMAELTGTVARDTGEVMRMSMAEVFVLRDGLIAERRAWVIPLTENDYR